MKATTQQCHSGVTGLGLDHPATGHLVSPEGRKIMAMCEEHAESIISEYREKLSEEWTFAPLPTNRDPDCCRTCGDEFGANRLNADGICGGCVNEAEGLCWCGGEPIPGHDRCAECQADEWADVRFHAMHEDGRRW